MTDTEKAKIISQWESGMTLAQIRQVTAVTPQEFDLAVREMKRNGEFPTRRKPVGDKIIEAYKRGERNPYIIAEQYGVKPRTIYTYLCRRKLSLGKKTKNFVNHDRTEAIIEDLRDGELNQAEIANKHGVSRQYVNKVKKRMEGEEQ